MKNKNLASYPEVKKRIRSICLHLENKKYEIVGRVGLDLIDNPQPSNLLSLLAMNFLFGGKIIKRIDKKEHLLHSIEVAKYIRRNNLLPSIESILSKKYPNISSVRRLLLVINVSFSEGRQRNTPVNASIRYRYKEKERG